MSDSLPTPTTWNSRPLDAALRERIEEIQTNGSFKGSPSGSLFLASFQKRALRRLAEVGLPAARHEAFSYCSPSSLFSLFRKGAAVAPSQERLLFASSPAEAEFLSFQAENELEESKEIESIQSIDDPIDLLALATAPAVDHFRLVTSPQETPLSLELRPLSGGALALRVVRLQMDPGTKATLAIYPPDQEEESAEGWDHLHLDIALGAGAELEISMVQESCGRRFSTSALTLRLADRARLTFAGAWEGGSFARQQMALHLDGTQAHCALKGISVIGGKRQMHHYISLHHHHPDSSSEQLFHQVVLDSASVSVDGTVMIDRGADGTTSNQLIRSLLLGAETMAAGKPRLIINTDDVEAQHGATHGPLEEEELFYLTSRGLSAAEAERALVRGFAEQVLGAIGSPELQTRAEEGIFEALRDAPLLAEVRR